MPINLNATAPPWGAPFSPDLKVHQIAGKTYVEDWPLQISVPPTEADRRRLAKDDGILYDEPNILKPNVDFVLLFANGAATYTITGPDPSRIMMTLAEYQYGSIVPDALKLALGGTVVTPEPAKPVPAYDQIEEVYVADVHYYVRFPETILVMAGTLRAIAEGSFSVARAGGDRIYLLSTNGEATYLLAEEVPSLNGTLAYRLYARIDFPPPVTPEGV